MNKSILIVEDDRGLNIGLCQALKTDDRTIFSEATLKAARETLLSNNIDLVILDINLPDGNGVELLKEIKRSSPKTAVILLTANDTDLDIVSGLDSGADDYITKPFSLSVLRARVNLQLRRGEESLRDVICIEHYSFDFENQKFLISDEPIELSKTEQRLLRKLILNRGNTLTREQLISYIWAASDFIEENALSVAVKRLRDKLNDDSYIQTVYGIGYRWVDK